ncbi:hypothetical protein [Roseobacter weihaiensis]|uniref:hypothetical protein n=1 Tax=Roseobacter weihaiensis TaxID=2763262 RepID=UPI001D0A1490|nr:hypothetical protein [Roseobacter sp. H9]
MTIHKSIGVQDGTKGKPAIADFAAALCCVAGFMFYKFLLSELFEEGPIVSACAPLLVFASCLFFPGLSQASVSPAMRIVCRVVAVMLGLYALAAVITYPAGISGEADTTLAIIRFIPLVAIAAAIMSFWYPAFVIVPATVVLAKKAVGTHLFEIRISHTDYLAVVEMGIILGIAAILLGRGGRWASGKPPRTLFGCDAKAASVIVFMIAVAAHFSNYFYSGIQKIELDGGPFFWALQNPTHVLSISAWIGGYFPLGSWPDVATFAIQSAEKTHVVLNITILLGQLVAVLFIAKRATMIGLTLFYDLTHVIIFLVSGIFFWKWIILNLALVAAMRRLPSWVEIRSVAAVGVATVVLAPAVFGIVWLGWYDTRALVVSETYAVTQSGDVLRVPSNFFGTISVTAAQHRFGRTEPGHFPTVTWGSTQTAADLKAARSDCAFDEDLPPRFSRTPEQVAETIQLMHLYALQREERSGQYFYDFFPHHIWSNPLLSKDFGAIAVRDIKHYVYRTRSGCVSLDETGPVFDERKVNEFIVPLSGRS